jgi:glycosyltransferase involved in cell wall biosynthesis
MDPLVSVIIPVWNGVRTLDRTLNSLVEQSSDIEVLAVDQASSDGSADILDSFRTRLPLTIINAPQSTSWTMNTNIGLRAAAASIVAILHQDDIWLPGRVEGILALASRFPRSDLFVHSAFLIDEHDRRIGSMAPPFGPRDRLVNTRDALRILLVQNTVALPSAAFRREAALAVGGLSENLWYTADWDLWLKLAARGPVAWSPKQLAAFRVHTSSQTVSRSVDLQDFETQLAAPLEMHIGKLKPSEARRILRYARASNMLNVYLAARYHSQKLSVWPFLKAFSTLGPVGWFKFLTHTQILQRTLPRIRLFWGSRLARPKAKTLRKTA